MKPRARHRRGSDTIQLRGSPEQIAAAKEQINELVEERRSIATSGVRVDSRYYGTIIGARGANLQDLQTQYNVRINVPSQGGRGGARGGRGGRGGSRSGDEITIRGKIEDVEAARNAILELVESEVCQGVADCGVKAGGGWGRMLGGSAFAQDGV